MDKETEELILIVVVAFVFLRLLGTSTNTSLLAQQKLSAGTDTAYAADAAGVLNTFINDTTGD